MFATQRPLTLDEMAAVLAPIGSPTMVTPMGGGTFSAVQQVTLDSGQLLAVKTSVPDHGDRPPLLTYERDLLRTERDLLVALGDDAAIPTPTVVLDDFTRTHVDVDVVATAMLPGESWDAAGNRMSREATRSAGTSVGRIFAALHAHKGERFGYPADGFRLGAATWPEAFEGMLTAALDDAIAWGVDVRADDVRRVLERGRAALAEVDEPVLVHMDLWPGNVLLDPRTGAVAGIVDFERALWADPLAEFVGAESTIIGATNPDLLDGYVAAGGSLPRDAGAGTMSGFSRAADARTVLYRLYTVTIQQVEVVPRDFTGDWVPGHIAHLRRTRDALLAYVLES